MENKPKLPYLMNLPHQQQLFEATKHPHESLAQWAARLTRLGEDSGFGDIVFLDTLLRDKFINGLEPSRIKDFLVQKDYKLMTFKQVLDVAFTTAAQFEKEQKAIPYQLPHQ